jgi:hypothetical protein
MNKIHVGLRLFLGSFTIWWMVYQITSA